MKSNAEYLTPVKGYNYLPTVLMDQVVNYGINKDKVIDPLVKDVYNFDRSYMYSDSGNTFRIWSKIETELEERIVNSKFSKELKDSLLMGLTLHGLEQLVINFPELNAINNCSAKELFELIDNQSYSEVLVDKYLRITNTLGDILREADFGKSNNYLVYTPKARSYTRDDLSMYHKLNLPHNLHFKLQEVIKDLDVDELMLATKIKGLLTTYVNVGDNTNPNYQSATLVPKANAYLTYDGVLLTVRSSDRNMSISMFV